MIIILLGLRVEMLPLEMEKVSFFNPIEHNLEWD